MTLFEKSTSMQIIPFPAHYQLGYHNFDFSSFSRISCKSKGPQLRRNCGPFASPFGPFQEHFQAQIRVNKIQVTDCQCFKNIAKFSHLHLSGLPVADIASREAENRQII